MNLAELLLLAVALSMDAFAVSMCKGLAMRKISFKNALIIGLWFGFFQALMPLLGYVLGVQFSALIAAVDHWIAFILLAIIGTEMIKEALSKKEDDREDASLAFGKMLMLAFATSIDALAAGVSMALTPGTHIWFAITVTGVTTLLLSALGVKLGNIFGTKYKSKAELAGGVILILLGLKILLTDLGVLSFLHKN
ncbi:MAG: manganese efflux pump [Clostridia bacterium]|nr:manganese efflux pump [Clostridia bacterium]